MNSYRGTHQNVGPSLLVGTGEVCVCVWGGRGTGMERQAFMSRTDCSNNFWSGKANGGVSPEKYCAPLKLIRLSLESRGESGIKECPIVPLNGLRGESGAE